jgi:hypothetical protein
MRFIWASLGQPERLPKARRHRLKASCAARNLDACRNSLVPRQCSSRTQEGGAFIPGTKNDFGGSSTSEFGPLLQTVYPVAGPTTQLRYENFNSGDMANPCPVR